MNKHIKKISNYAMIRGFSALVLVALGCNTQKTTHPSLTPFLQDK